MSKLSLILCLALLLASCEESQTSKTKQDNTQDQDALTKPSTELHTGGVYLMRHENGTYYLAKILVVDKLAVHLRAYSDTFYTKPTDVNTANLSIMMGHAPLDIDGFLKDQPELLKVEAVKESELEGYNLYMDAMSK